MKIIPSLFANENEEFLTIPAIRRFAKDHNIKNISSCDRQELIETLQDFANNNEIEFYEWLEEILREGIKKVFCFKTITDLDNINFFQTVLSSHVKEQHYFGDIPSNNYASIYRYYLINDSSNGDILVINLHKKICRKKNEASPWETFSFPIVVEIYTKHSFITIKCKSTESIYEYADEEKDREKTSCEKIASEVINSIKRLFEIEEKEDFTGSAKNALYKILDKYTFTPQIIKDAMEQNETSIKSITELIQSSICNVNNSYKEDILWDIKNIVEKYMSITRTGEDIKVFTNDRNAYPVKLISMDEEDSRVEQTSCNSEPLQIKQIFFDNKKMLQKNQLCEGVRFKFKRLNTLYMEAEFLVVISTTKTRNRIIISFPKYTMQEDMQNVLSEIIGNWN